jgi:superfamily II RNA helicase
MDVAAPLYARLPSEADTSPDTLLDGFLKYVADKGLSLYSHQEEAILALAGDDNVILHTPTGSGKSLVATWVHFKAVAEGRRSFYTCPIKALVSEKFFDLCRELGPDQVGMMTGDATVNRDAPIICCTAEILANIALAEGANANIDYVVMDEFHYFSDKERGVAWQVPLLTLPNARFLLMSATLGDVTVFEQALTRLTSAKVVTVKSVERPVPLSFTYAEDALHETIHRLVEENRAPAYVVSFTQRGCAEEAQNLLSVDFCTKEEKKRIAEAIVGESFRSPYGKEIQKLIRHGIGIHHAGLLPRYRLLIEKLAQKGLLKVICGTDTLGVGVNVPIRSVVFTKLCKFDGEKVRILSVRDFQQIAGRAGRKGFDDHGYVIAQAPEHVVENLRLEAKARSGKMKKFVKKKAPEWGYVHWDKGTFDRLATSDPEPLVSRFHVSHGMLLSVLGRPAGGCRAMKRLVLDSLETPHQKKQHKKRALVLLRSLYEARVVSLRPFSEGGGISVNEDLQADFSLFHALGLYLVDAVGELDLESPSYSLDLLSLVEAIVENPDVILRAQVDKAKTKRLAELKAAGVEYDERMAELDKVEHPKPNAEFIYATFNAFAGRHPWVLRDNIEPKSIAREMIETFMTFSGYIKEYGLSRSEGLLLRYLSEVYKTLVQTVPEGVKTSEVVFMIAQFGSLVRSVDSSLIDEWERMRNPAYVPAPLAAEEPAADDITRDKKTFTALVRNLMYSFLRALQNRDYESALDLVEEGREPFTPPILESKLRAFFDAGSEIRLDAHGRAPKHTIIQETPGEGSTDGEWTVIQNVIVFVDRANVEAGAPEAEDEDREDVSDVVVQGRVDLRRSALEKRAVFLLDHVGPV